jgi:hypothetical protein
MITCSKAGIASCDSTSRPFMRSTPFGHNYLPAAGLTPARITPKTRASCGFS